MSTLKTGTLYDRISKSALQFSRTFLWSLHMLHADYSTMCSLNVVPLNLVFPLSVNKVSKGNSYKYKNCHFNIMILNPT
jgi:hypothetical protein